MPESKYWFSKPARQGRAMLQRFGTDEHHRLLAALNRIFDEPGVYLEALMAWKFLTRDRLGRLHLVVAEAPTTEAIFAYDEFWQMVVIEFRLLNGKPLTPRNLAGCTTCARLQ